MAVLPLILIVAGWPIPARAAPAEAPAAAAVDAFREELFVLERPVGDRPGRAEPVGVAARRAARDGTHLRLECEVLFPLDDLRLVLVEEHELATTACAGGLAGEASPPRGGGRLVWREVRGRAGRTLRVEWSASREVLALTEWGSSRRHHLELAPPPGLRFPLELDEALRAGELGPGAEVPRFDPLANGFERLAVRGPDDVPELCGDDGTSRGWLRFDEDGLRAFAWQAGGPVARRVEPGEHARALELLRERARGARAEDAVGPDGRAER